MILFTGWDYTKPFESLCCAPRAWHGDRL